MVRECDTLQVLGNIQMKDSINFEFKQVRLAFRHAGVALLVTGVVSSVFANEDVEAIVTAIILGVITVCLTAITRKNQ